MRKTIGLTLLTLVIACQRTPDHKREPEPVLPAQPTGPAAPPAVARPTVKPPLPVASPPADAEKITGVVEAPDKIVYVKRLSAGTGERPGRNDTVMINMTGWRLNGDTFLSTKERGRAVQQNLAMLAPGFTAAVQTMQVGERVMVWVPPELGYMGPPQDKPETTVYEIELVSFEKSPPTPPDVAKPPADATRSRTGLVSLVVKPGTGKDHPRSFDGVTFHYTAWDRDGRMFDSSELRGRPKSTFGFHEWPGIEEALTLMVVGERRRIWLTPELADTTLPGLPRGVVCYELELTELVPMSPPPPVPSNLNARPADATLTPAGVYMQILKPGTGTVHPAPADKVKVAYTGWRLDGRMFDSSVVRGESAEFVLGKLMPGWIDAIQMMTAGQKVRLWVPEKLAFNGESGRPAGELVFDLELLDVTPVKPTTLQTVPGPPAPPAGKP